MPPRLAEADVPVRQITTGTVCHLEAEMVEQALGDWRLDESGFSVRGKRGEPRLPGDL